MPQTKQVVLKLPDKVAKTIGCSCLSIIGSAIDKSVVKYIELNGFYEPHVQLALMEYLSQGDTCIDIGANIGVHSILMSKLVGLSGQVYCYEASLSNYIFLMQNLALNNCDNNVRSEQVGIWNEPIELEFSYVQEVAGCSFFSSTGIREGETQVVACKPLDDLLLTYPKENRISLIKIDVEGAEIHAIKSANKLIQRDHPIIILEINPETMRRFFKRGVQELIQTIVDFGYSIDWLKPEGSIEYLQDYHSVERVLRENQLFWIDVLCRPK